MSRTLRKLLHKYEYLLLELEESEEKLNEYSTTWSSIFGKYFAKDNIEVWINEETGEVSYTPPKDPDPILLKKKPEKVKKLFKVLSKITHPDKGGSSEEFNAISTLYEKDDYLGLIHKASHYGIEVNVDENDLSLAEETCLTLQKKIEYNKKTLAWIYCNGDKKDKLLVIKALELQFGIKIPKDELPSEILD